LRYNIKILIEIPKIKMKKFYFGAALSAHQSEGHNIHSDWWEFEQNILAPLGVPTSGKANNHFEFFDEDFHLAEELGFNAHRLSIEWAKIEPRQGQIDYKMIEHYHKVFQSLKDHHLTPFVTLFHFSLPKWFADLEGFAVRENNRHFENYCKLIATEFREELKYIFTINEPEVYAYNSYLTGIWPPQEKSYRKFLKILKNLAMAHKDVYYAIKAINPDIKISIAKNNQIFIPDRRFNLLDIAMTTYLKQQWNNKFIIRTKKELDFIGLNYYFYRCVKVTFRHMDTYCQLSYPTTRKTDLDWEVYPKGLFTLTRKLWKKFKIPIVISEHGVADKMDHLRQEVIKEGFYWIFKSIKAGSNIFGYFHWALLDNYEWDKGFEPRFGLIKVDYDNFSRTIRPSALVYQQLIKKYQQTLNNDG